ncbi:MAG: TonB-dependent receptor [Calditrichaeota bacterium]|nr:MAG: TonB-dependent receptor [Calditrichota bacterium]MBL1205409.1 TonB-dependent receptor [Calditrichota bacterium]NOG45238.1 TonB-dependent receptor [Calditrichota bacterium]
MKIITTLFMICILSAYIFAGTTGKIVGSVYDSETNEPLIGVNVYLEGTSIGAATDVDGIYSIINVPSGTYLMVASYIGYSEKKIENVKVSIDLTTNVNIEMVQESLTSEVIIVTAEKELVVRDISNSQAVLQAKELESLPVTTLNQAISIQAGVELSTNGIIIRGGNVNETAVIMDGFSLNDERSNNPYSSLNPASVEEVQVQTGGFNAEYGQARSGLVNVITKEGDKNSYSITVNTQYSAPGLKNFGKSIYNKNSYFNRPFYDPDVAWVGTLEGAWDEHTKNQYIDFKGWQAVADETLEDDDPTNDLTPEGAQQLFKWQHRRDGTIDKSDYNIDFGFGGPIPFGSYLGNARFYFSFINLREMFVFPLSRDSYGDTQGNLKITSDITNTMKLTISGFYGETESVSPYNWTTTPTGYILRSTSEIANLLNSSDGNSILYMPGYYSPTKIYRSSFGVKLNETINSSSFYEVSIQYKNSKYNTFQTRDRNTSEVYEPVPGYFVDEAPFGYMGFGEAGIDGMGMGGWMNIGRDDSEISTWNLNSAYSLNANHNNLIKAGLQITYNDFDINSTSVSPSNNFWNRSQVYQINPFRVGAYIQDKMEFHGFIANVGLRFDYSNSNTKKYTLEDYDKFYSEEKGSLIEDEAPSTNAKSRFTISPRLGISHPISENSKLYFNYGHFRSEPVSSLRFRIQRESSGLVKSIGNPSLDLEKTVSYELGYEHNISDLFLLKVAGYYKDITNQADWVYYQSLSGNVKYNIAENNNYEDIRGFELTLSKQAGGWVSGLVNYTYDVRTSGYFGVKENYENPNEQRAYLLESPIQFKSRPRPYARANIAFHSPANYSIDPFVNEVISNWHLSLLWKWKSGAYLTESQKKSAALYGDAQWTDFQNTDIRVSKNIRIKTVDLQVYMQIKNVFNNKLMSSAGFSDRDDYYKYLGSLNFSWETGEEKGDDRIGDYRPSNVAYDPLEQNPNNDPEIAARNKKRKKNKSYIDNPNIKSFTFLNPRDIWFGLKINF